MIPPSEKHHGLRQVLEIILLVVFLFAMVVLFRYVGNDSNTGTLKSVISTPAALSPLQTPLPVNVNEVWKATKQAIVQTEAARPTPAASVQVTRLKPTPAGLTNTTPEPTAFAFIPGSTPVGHGAVAQIAPPFSTSAYHIQNAWYMNLKDGRQRVVVYAGSLAAPGGTATEQGVVIVVKWGIKVKDGRTIVQMVEMTPYVTQGQNGSVRIVDAVGERIVLANTVGNQFYFDVPARQFAVSLTTTLIPVAPQSTTMP